MRTIRFLAATSVFLLFVPLVGCRSSAEKERIAADEAAAVTHLQAFTSAQASFNEARNHYACTIAELAGEPGVLSQEMSTAKMDGYAFTIHCLPQTGLSTYQIWATPLQRGQYRVHLYCSDQSGALGRAKAPL